MEISSFNKPTEHPWNTFGSFEIESFMWWFFKKCFSANNLNTVVATTHNHDHLVSQGLLHKEGKNKYRLTKKSKGKLFTVYGKDDG